MRQVPMARAATGPRCSRSAFAGTPDSCYVCASLRPIGALHGSPSLVRAVRAATTPTKPGTEFHADDQPACPQAAPEGGLEDQDPGASRCTAEARCVHARVYDDPEEAELGASQGRPCAPH